MKHPRYSGEEIGRRGQEIYQQSLQSLVETQENIGKIISIDIETGDYEIADDLKGRQKINIHSDDNVVSSWYGHHINYSTLSGTRPSTQ